MDKENENNASVEGITTAVFCREGDLKQFTDVFARLGRSCTAAQKGGIDEAQAWLTQHDAPGLLVVDISASPFPACKSSKDHSKPRNEVDTSLKSPV